MWKQRKLQLILPSASTNYEIWSTSIRQEVRPPERNQKWKWRNANTNASTSSKAISNEVSCQHLAKKKPTVLTPLFSIWIFEHWDICQMISKANFHLTWANRWSQTLAQPLKAAVYMLVCDSYLVSAFYSQCKDRFSHRESSAFGYEKEKK